MSTSASTLPPVGQRHDREDAEMQDGQDLTNGQSHVEQASTEGVEPTTNTIAVEVAAIEEDAMDTTADTDQHLVLPNAPASQTNLSAGQPPSPSTDSAGREEIDNSIQTVPVVTTDDAVSERIGPGFAQ